MTTGTRLCFLWTFVINASFIACMFLLYRQTSVSMQPSYVTGDSSIPGADHVDKTTTRTSEVTVDSGSLLDNKMTNSELDQQLTNSVPDNKLTNSNLDNKLTNGDLDQELTNSELDNKFSNSGRDQELTNSDLDKELTNTEPNREELSNNDLDNKLSYSDRAQMLTNSDLDQELTNSDVDQELINSDLDQELTNSHQNKELTINDLDDKQTNSYVDQELTNGHQDKKLTNRLHTQQASNRTQSPCGTDQRARYVEERCTAMDLNDQPINWSRVSGNLLVDDKHKIIYCDIPKCGSKSFKHYLGQMSSPQFRMGMSVNMKFFYNVTGIRNIGMLSDNERSKVLKEYFKFVVVRHPFDRLRSAWMHKLSEPGKSHALRGMEGIVNKYLKRYDSGRKKIFNFKDDYLTFEQFLELITLERHSGFTNSHWASYYEHCQPCHIKYDHVLRLETLSRDMNVIYDHLRMLSGSNDIQKLAHDNKVRAADGIDKLNEIHKLYSHIDPGTIQGLQREYSKDFSLFGYDWDLARGATCSFDDIDCC